MLSQEANNLVYTPVEVDHYDFTRLNEVLLTYDLPWRGQYDRGAKFLPVLDWNTQEKKVDWLGAFRHFGGFQEWVTENILKFTDPLPTINVLYSPPGLELPVHVDASQVDWFRRRPVFKYRTLMKGHADTLYFLDKKRESNKVKIPNQYNHYVINGAAIHGMTNYDEEKLILAVGWPWKGRNGLFDQYIREEMKKFSNQVITFDQIDNNQEEPGMFETMGYTNESHSNEN